jgi:siderophore synthetase component
MKTNPTLPQPDSACNADQRDDMLDHARSNALRRIVRCLFAEKIIDDSLLVFTPHDDGAWLPLWHRRAVLYFDDLWAAPADTIINRGSITLVEADGKRTVIDTAERLIDLLRDRFDFSPSDEGIENLKADIANSVANDALARVYRNAWDAELAKAIDAAGATGLVDYLRRHSSTRDAAVLLDQWGSLEGHPFYPTWKSKPDLGPDEVAALSPEFNSRVGVRIAALRADMAYIERMPHVENYHQWFADRFPSLWASWKENLNSKQLSETDWLPLPIHSWHLEHYVRREYAAEIDDGILILEGPDIETMPTMSFRTMAPVSPDAAPFIKLPIALWLTSEQRSLQAKSIHMGPRISTLIQRILADENGFGQTMEILPEEVAFHYRHAVRQEDRPGRHLSVAYRACRQAFDRTDGLLPVTVAALFTRSPSGSRPLVTELIECGGDRASAAQVESWFRHYARVVTRPVLGIYLLYGVGLEAHQQNAAVLFSKDGTATSLLIRDFGDGRTYAPLLRQRGYDLEPYVHPGILPTVFTDDIEPVRTFVLSACFVCHLHELALLLTREYAIPSPRLWEVLREETARTFDWLAPRVPGALWEAERTAFLEQPWPTRSLLRMHLLLYADYRLQHALANPLASAQDGN